MGAHVSVFEGGAVPLPPPLPQDDGPGSCMTSHRKCFPLRSTACRGPHGGGTVLVFRRYLMWVNPPNNYTGSKYAPHPGFCKTTALKPAQPHKSRHFKKKYTTITSGRVMISAHSYNTAQP